MDRVLFPFKALYANNKESRNEGCFLYRIIGEKFNSYALIGLLPHELFLNNQVLPHETTLKSKETKYITSFLQERQQLNPVLLFYKERQLLSMLLETIETTEKPIFKVEKAGDQHLLYPINNKELLAQIQTELKQLSNFYIGDGHHRVQALLQAAATDDSFPKFCLSMLVADSSLHVASINRCIKRKLNGDFEQVLNAITERFDLFPQDKAQQDINSYRLFMKGNWYQMQLKDNLKINKSMVDNLPPFVLEKHLLKPVFMIEDQHLTTHLEFIPEHYCIEDRLAIGDADIAVCIPALNIDEIYRTAELGKMMPPHSTYLQPKSLDNIISWKF